MAALARTAKAERWRERLGAELALVISNRPQAAGLGLAQELGLATSVVDHTRFADRATFEAALRDMIDPVNPCLVVLAGFMRVLTPAFVHHYAGRLINIHPSLLPAFTGLHTHERALAAGCRFAGATVHWVSTELDQGDILGQAVVPVLAGDSAATLGARVLSQEHRLYPRVIAELLPTLQQRQSV